MNEPYEVALTLHVATEDKTIDETFNSVPELLAYLRSDDNGFGLLEWEKRLRELWNVVLLGRMEAGQRMIYDHYSGATADRLINALRSECSDYQAQFDTLLGSPGLD